MLSNSHRHNLNQPPGMLIYTGEYKRTPHKLELLVYDEEDFEFNIIDSIDEIKKDQKLKWLNVIGLNRTEFIKEIGEKFKINPLVLEDIVHVSHRSKIEIHEHYLFSVFKMVYLKSEKIIHEHLSMILMDNLLITFQEEQGDVFDPIRERIREKKGNIREMKVDYLYYALVDALVDQYFDILLFLSIGLDELEEQIIEEENISMEAIYSLRKELLLIKSAVIPIKDVFHNFLGSNQKFISEEVKIYFEDIKDHLNQVTDSVIMYREMASSLSETNSSNMSNNMNKIMTTLTIFSAVFIPLSFLSGVFGMNFTNMPVLDFQLGYYFFIVSCIVIAVGMLSYFKIKKWY